MAEVLGPIVGPTSTMTMLHTPQDAFQPAPSNPAKSNRNSMYNTPLSNVGYRGTTAVPRAPVAPYAFQTTPMLRQEATPIPRQEHRLNLGAVSKQTTSHSGPYFRAPYQDSSSSSASSSSSSSNQSARNYAISKDDSVLGIKQPLRLRENRLSTHVAGSLSTPDLSMASFDVVKASPDRYRRNSRRFEAAAVGGTLQGGDHAQAARPTTAPTPAVTQRPIDKKTAVAAGAPVAMSQAPRQTTMEEASTSPAQPLQNSSRYKRRSVVGKMESTPPTSSVSTPLTLAAPVTWSQVVAGKHNIQGPLPPPIPTSRPVHHLRSSSATEVRIPPTNRPAPARHSTYIPSRSPLGDNRPQAVLPMSHRPKTSPAPMAQSSSNMERPGTAPVLKISEPEVSRNSSATDANAAQPVKAGFNSASSAVKQLNDITGKANKVIKNRLRRALSFGGSQELRRATAENNMAAERARLRREKFDSEKETEDASVVAKQEANGLGASIYTNQGEFASSTDNISISSTASSASIMLRKVGKGMKKSTRNLRNLFRPKSMVGSSSPDNAVLESELPPVELTFVTVEAEREKVNVNLDPHDIPGGGTGYPRLERNSIDASQRPESPASANETAPHARKSIVGGDRERAEVLAAVRKGILKRVGTGSNASSPVTPNVEHSGESAPSTPYGRKSSESGKGDNYFGVDPKATGSTKSLPNIHKQVSFGPRVTFCDVYSASDYDRRGEVATCNRLTPMLAQQIKEELNTFKMEMEVHEESKPHTHFF